MRPAATLPPWAAVFGQQGTQCLGCHTCARAAGGPYVPLLPCSGCVCFVLQHQQILSYCLSKCETHIFYVCQLQEIKYCWSRRSTKASHTASDGGQHFTLIKQQRSVLVHWYACTLLCMQKLVVFRLPKKHTWSNTSSEIACSLLWDTWICWHSDSAHQPD